MKLISPTQAVPTHIISGFLGAGKTTLLKHLLSQKPENEVWAVLMNEFGQIGVDQQMLPQTQGYEVKELLGGCLCCSSQLPMQIALSRLLSETKPNRLFIELVTVVDGSRLHDRQWTEQNLYADQLKAAQIIVVSHADGMDSADQQALEILQTEYQAYAQTWLKSGQADIALEQIDQPYIGTERKIQPLLKIQKTLLAGQTLPEIKQLPYHYVETTQGYSVAGWKLPKRWLFDFYPLLDLLCEQQNWLRIKGIFHTNQGWKTFNFNPQQFNYQSSEEGIDNRIEIIVQDQRDWQHFEDQLFQCQLNADNTDKTTQQI